MSYTAPLYFALFLPLVMIVYSIFPQKRRWLVLLFASYLFFAMISGGLVVYLIISTVTIHWFALWIASYKSDCDKKSMNEPKDMRKKIKAEYQKKQRAVLVLAVIIHIGLLLFLKYFGFFTQNINALLSMMSLKISIPSLSILVPIGISFYTLQAVSYMVDVYRSSIIADKNIGRLALFMSFFPQIMEGPICRYSQTANSLYEGSPIKYKNMTFGYQRIVWGLFKKIIIADRLSAFVNTVFSGYQNYSGIIIFLAMLSYTIQLYMDFSGSIDIVIGSGEIFGIKLPENFRQPFFSKNVSEFWTRWHITLGTFFKDYIFYPLSLSKPLKKLTVSGRKHLGNHFGPLLSGACALFVVWLCNGLWHGAGWNYIFFGMYYFVLILLANITSPLTKKIMSLLHIKQSNPVLFGWQLLRTFILVNIGELFFRATSLSAGFSMFGKMFSDFSLTSIFDGTVFNLGVDKHDVLIVAIALIVVLIISILHEKGIAVREKIAGFKPALRWSLYYAAVLSVIIFGAYGNGYIPVGMLYASF